MIIMFFFVENRIADRQVAAPVTSKHETVVQGQDGLGRVWESEFRAENKGGPVR